MPGMTEMRDKALSKYDDDLNEIEPEGMHEMPEGEMMADADMEGMEEEGGAPAAGPEAMITDMLGQAGIQASPEQVTEFMGLLQGAAEEAMAAEGGGAMEAEGAEMGAEMAEEPMV
mgnify:FL=1|tara:strand:+ start:328 stop:675 length:348 start_codon:yes stop_codon:yes gene_type:complete